MLLRGKKLTLLLSTTPDHPNFQHGIRVAESALAKGVDVYLYCIDDAVTGVDDLRLQKLKAGGVKLFACAYGTLRRNLALSDRAVFAGLTILSDLISGTDRFLSFN